MSKQIKEIYEFGEFRFDAAERLLFCGDQEVQLTPKAIDLLLELVQSGGRVLSKEELMQAVWADSFVEEVNLAHHISVLRKVLGDGKKDSHYIETLPRRGYRFVAKVNKLSAGNGEFLLAERVTAKIVLEELDVAENDEECPAAQKLVEALPDEAQPSLSTSVRPRHIQIALAVATSAILLGVLVTFLISKSTNPKPPAEARIKSIAVLPLKPLVATQRDEAFEMGVTETLINKLSSLKDVTVRPLIAVRKYATLEQDSVTTGHELGVESVLDSYIQWDGNKVKISSRLVRVEDGAVLWTGTCNTGECESIFVLQDSIVEQVAMTLVPSLSGEEERQIAKRYTDNEEAFRLYIKGRFFWNKRTAEGLKMAIDYFQAIEKDPTYALAYSGIADSYIVLASWSVNNLSPHEAMPKAKAAALKALEIDNTLAEAYTSLADVGLLYDWDWPMVERNFRRAIDLKPQYATAHQWYSNYLTAMGRYDEAIEQIRMAYQIDPLSSVISQSWGYKLYMARRYDEAIKQLLQAIEADKNFVLSHNSLSLVYLEKAMYAEAVAEIQKALELSKGNPKSMATLAQTYAASGRISEAKQILEQLENTKDYVASFEVAVVYARLNDQEQAFKWLETAYAERNNSLIFIKSDPGLDRLRSNSRFLDLLRRMGFYA